MADKVVSDCGLLPTDFARRISTSNAAKAVDSQFGERVVTAMDMLKDINASNGPQFPTVKDGYLITILRELLLRGTGSTLPLTNHKQKLETHQTVAFGREDLDVRPVSFYETERDGPKSLDVYYDEKPKAIGHDAGIAPNRLLTIKDTEYAVFLANMFDQGAGGRPKKIEAAIKFPQVGQIVRLTPEIMSCFGFQDLDITMNCTGSAFTMRVVYKGEVMDEGDNPFTTPIDVKTKNKYFAGNNEKNAAIQLLLIDLRKHTKNKPLSARLVREVEKYLIGKELGDMLILLMAIVYAICHPETSMTAFSGDGVFCARLLEFSKGLGNVAVVREIRPENGAHRVIRYGNKAVSPDELRKREFEHYKQMCIAHNDVIRKKIAALLLSDSVKYGGGEKPVNKEVRALFGGIDGILAKANAMIPVGDTREAVTERKAIDFFTSRGLIDKGVKHLFVKGSELNAEFTSLLGTDLVTRIQRIKVGKMDNYVGGGPVEKRPRNEEPEPQNVQKSQKIQRDYEEDTTSLQEILENLETYLHMSLDPESAAEFARILDTVQAIPYEETKEIDVIESVRLALHKVVNEDQVERLMSVVEPYFNHFMIAIGLGGEDFYMNVFDALGRKGLIATDLPELTLSEFRTLLGSRLDDPAIRKSSPPGGMGGGRRTRKQKRKVTRRKPIRRHRRTRR
jgi:hypothetical protein